MCCFCRWSFDGKYFAKKGDDVLSIYESSVSVYLLLILSFCLCFFVEFWIVG